MQAKLYNDHAILAWLLSGDDNLLPSSLRRERIKTTRTLAKPARQARHIDKNKWRKTVKYDTDRDVSIRQADWSKNECFRAWVMPLVGSGPEQHRDRRHPDLKPKPRRKNIGGFPGNVVSKHGHELTTIE